MRAEARPPLAAARAAKGPGSVAFATELVDLEVDADGVHATLAHGGSPRALGAG